MLGIDKRAARITWSCAWVLLVIYGLFWIRKTLLVFVVALMFAYLLYPLVEVVDRRLAGKKRTLALILPFILLLVFVAVFASYARLESARLKVEIQKTIGSGELQNTRLLGLPVGQMIADNFGRNQIQSTLQQFSPEITRGARAAGRELLDLFLVPILAFLMLKDGRYICDSILEIWFDRKAAGAISRNDWAAAQSMLMDAHFLILEYMRALLLLCLATLIFFSLGLSLMHVEYAILLAIMAAPLEFVPMVGPIVSAIIILTVCKITGYPHLLLVAFFLGAYRLFQDYVLSPYLMERGVKLHPLLVLFGVLAGAEIGKVGGVFLSVPVLALIRLIYYEWRKHQTVPQPAVVSPEVVT